MTQAKFIKRSPPGCIVTGAEKLQKVAKNPQKLTVTAFLIILNFHFIFLTQLSATSRFPHSAAPIPSPY